jgi:hypothetical protein
MKNLFLIACISFSSLAFADYQTHFPTYFEYCTGSQWKLQSGEAGGKPGHGFTYIHGLCKDYRSAYPQVIPCHEVEPAVGQAYPHEGVGISLDKNFSNVSWVAVPGRELMLFGEQERTAINESEIEAVIQRVTDLRIFQDVVMKDASVSQHQVNTSEHQRAAALATLGTDYAVNWARELHCVRIPVPASTLPKVAEFLNRMNNMYREGEGYKWDKFANNCVHLSLNTSHVMGMNKEVKTDQPFLKQLTSLAVPANAFLTYVDLAIKPKASVRNILRSESFRSHNYFPAQVGSLMLHYQAYPAGSYFATDELKSLTLPRFLKGAGMFATPGKYTHKHGKIENLELEQNAIKWISTYQRLLERLPPSSKGTAIENYLQSQLHLSQEIAGPKN